MSSQQQQTGENAEILDEVLHFMLLVGAVIDVPEVVHVQADHDGQTSQQKGKEPSLPARHEREPTTNLHDGRQQQRRHCHWHSVLCHVGDHAVKTRDFHQARDEEVQSKSTRPVISMGKASAFIVDSRRKDQSVV